MATIVPSPDPTKLDEVARQRAIWAQQGIHTYRLTLLFGCECGLGGGNPVEVTVVDDRMTGAAAMGRALDADEVAGYPMTVDQLFDYADRNASAGKLELKYDEHLGYPVALGVDPRPQRPRRRDPGRRREARPRPLGISPRPAPGSRRPRPGTPPGAGRA